MRPQVILSVLSLSLLVAACSSTSTHTQASTAAKPAATPAPAATAGTPAAATKTASTAGAVNQDYLKRGYKLMKSKGEVLYCRSETITGTKFKSNVCLTENQIKEQDENTREAGRELDRQRAPGCVAPPCS